MPDDDRNDRDDDHMRIPNVEGLDKQEPRDAEQPTLPDAGLHLIHPDLADEARKAAIANMLGVDESATEEDQQER